MAKKNIASIVRVDGSTERLPTTLEEMDLAEVQRIVGGYIEHVSIHGIGDLWCNEYGLLQRLPFNNTVSQIANRVIVGDVIIESWE